MKHSQNIIDIVSTLNLKQQNQFLNKLIKYSIYYYMYVAGDLVALNVTLLFLVLIHQVELQNIQSSACLTYILYSFPICYQWVTLLVS